MNLCKQEMLLMIEKKVIAAYKYFLLMSYVTSEEI